MDLLNASFRVGRLLGIEIRVHILFVIWIAFRLLSDREGWVQEAWFLGMLFGIVLIHEFGHCLGARSVGGDARTILMWPLGGLAFAHAPMRPWPQFVTVACGPLVNLVFCLVSGAYLVAVTGSFELVLLNPFRGIFVAPLELGLLAYAWIFYQVNLMLLAFNLLPIYPLDGGQLFQTILWPFAGLQRAMYIACQVGIIGCILLGLWGLQGGGGMLIFIAIFGGFTCYQRLQMLRFGMIVDERIGTYDWVRRDRPSLWKRWFSRRRRPRVIEPETPPPAAWSAEEADWARTEAELDRILQKVHDKGIQSLSYVEQQTLERATRERQRRELERYNRQ